MLDLGTLVLKITADNTEANKTIDETGEKAGGLGGKLGKAGKIIAGGAAAVTGAVAGAAAGLYKFVDSQTQAADAIDKGSQKMGISAEEYQTLQFAAEHCGMSIDDFQKASMKLNDLDTSKLSETSASFIEQAEAAGVNTGNISEMMDSLLQVESVDQRVAIAQELFGDKTAASMMPLLNGQETISDFGNSLEELGSMMSNDTVAASAAFQDSITDIKTAFSGVMGQVLTQVMPVATEMVNMVMEHMPEIQAVISEAMSVIGDVVSVAIGIIKALSPVVKTVFNAIKGFWNNILKPVLSAITPTIEKLANSFSNAFQKIMDFAQRMFNTVKSVFDKISGVIGGIKDTAASVGNFFGGLLGGSHRTGLREVPYDGYVAELHKGEMVLTAAQANKYKQEQTGEGKVVETNITVNNYSPKALSEAETARLYRKTQRGLALND